MGAVVAYGQYTVQSAGAPPEELSAEIVDYLAPEGQKVVGDDGAVWAEFWFAKESVEGNGAGELDVSWGEVAHGKLVGAMRFPAMGEERRGMEIEPGVYTLRFSYYPVDGAHQGVEPSRDFLILAPAGIDKDPGATPDFETLMEMSEKASGTHHPAGLACWKAEGDFQDGISKFEEDVVLGAKVGDTEIMVVVKGVNTH
jgi:hypothetical protein